MHRPRRHSDPGLCHPWGGSQPAQGCGGGVGRRPTGHRAAGGSDSRHKSGRRMDRGSGIASTSRSRGPERGCLPRSPRDDGSEAATCVVWISRGRWGHSCPRPHAGERQPHYQLPSRTAVWLASGPRGVSRRDTKPYGRERGGASLRSTSLAKLWSSSGNDPGGRSARGCRPGAAASVRKRRARSIRVRAEYG